jgi:hypothetical protein
MIDKYDSGWLWLLLIAQKMYTYQRQDRLLPVMPGRRQTPALEHIQSHVEFIA